MRFRSLLAMISFVAAFITVTAPPSSATVPPSISVNVPAPVFLGEHATFTGRALRAPAGSTATAQVDRAGTWVSMTLARLSATGTYRLTTAPPVGAPRYRVILRNAQRRILATSRTVTVVVKRPTAPQISATPSFNATTHMFSVTGSAAGAPAHASIQLQSLAGSTWTDLATSSVATGGTYRVTSPLTPGDHSLRVAMPATVSTLPATSPAMFQGVDAYGRLVVNVVGAPPGSSPNIVISDGAFTYNPHASAVYDPVWGGAYTVTADPFVLGDQTWSAAIDPNPVDVPWNEQTATVTITYSAVSAVLDGPVVNDTTTPAAPTRMFPLDVASTALPITVALPQFSDGTATPAFSVTVLDPNGTQVLSYQSATTTVGQFQPGTTGTYKIYVTNLNPTSGSFGVNASDPIVTATTITSDSPIDTGSNPGREMWLTFPAQAGQLFSDGAFGSNLIVSRPGPFAPDGSTLTPINGEGSSWGPIYEAPTTGIYTVEFNPTSAVTMGGFAQIGAATPQAATVDGPATTVTPDPAAVVTFDATAGQELSVATSIDQGVYDDQALLQVYGPDGHLVARPTDGNPYFPDKFIAGATGTYTVYLTALQYTEGPMHVWVSTPAQVAATIDGPTIQFTPSQRPGQATWISFQATAGSALTENIANTTNWPNWPSPLYDSTGATVPALNANRPAWLISTDGTYHFEYPALSSTPPSADINLLSANQLDATVNGPAVVVPIDIPGRVAMISLPATQGQVVTVTNTAESLTPSSTTPLLVWCLAPGMQYEGAFQTNGGSLTFTAPATATYTIVLGAGDGQTGTVTLTATAP